MASNPNVGDLLALMPMFNNSLRVGNGEQDEARAVLALTTAQHYFETVAATYARVLGSTITVAPSANTETTTYPATLLRLDSIWLLDATTLLPVRRLKRIESSGGHAPSLPWPLQLVVQAGTGMPAAYFANMASFYWLPLPDSAQTLRIYGFVEQPEFVDRLSAFNYPLRTKAALASFAVKILKTSTDDDTAEVDALASAIFGPLLRGLKQFDRSEPHGRTYGEVHDT